MSIHDGKGDNLFPLLPAGEVRLVVVCVCVVCLHDSPSRIVAKNLSILCKDGNDLIQLYSDIQTTLHIISITIIIVIVLFLSSLQHRMACGWVYVLKMAIGAIAAIVPHFHSPIIIIIIIIGTR